MPRPVVSVVVLTKDRIALLADALQSVVAQDIAAPREIVVVNNGGVDVPMEVLATGERNGTSVEYVRLDVGKSEAEARNIGLSQVSGEYVGFLDDDDLLLPHHARVLLEAIERSGAPAAYSSALVADRRSGASLPDRNAIRWVFDYEFRSSWLSIANYLSIDNVLVREDLIRQCRFDESPSVNRQADWDMWLQVASGSGGEFAYVPTPSSVVHRIVGVSTTATSDNVRLHKEFKSGYSSVIKKWSQGLPSEVGSYRRYMLDAHDVAAATVATGERLAPFHYLQVLDVLFDSYPSPSGPQEIGSRVARAVRVHDTAWSRRVEAALGRLASV